MRTLWVYAAPAEGKVLGAGAPALELGVGKAAAATTLTAALVTRSVTLVVAIGVCGAHRGAQLGIGSTCVVAQESFVDEGVEHPGGFLDLAALGLGDAAPIVADPAGVRAAADVLDAAVVAGGTVSTCSGTDALAKARAARCPAVIETMEGAAIALVCQRLGVPWVGVRTVSNFTGDRDRAQWDLPRALEQLGGACTRLREAGW
jgi:futalosine hydrolase